MASAIEQIEAALGKAICSQANPCGYVVQQVDGGYRIADDWTQETLSTVEAAVTYARECLAMYLERCE